MKNLITLCFLLIGTTGLFGQVRLDVEGDAKILGKMDIIQAVGDSSIFIGANAGMNAEDITNNIFVGTNAGKSTTSGIDNSFFGQNVGRNNQWGKSNSFFGLNTGEKNVSGSGNAFFGTSTGKRNINGGNNAFFGGFTGVNNIGGGHNAYFGTVTGTVYNNNKSTLLGALADSQDDLDRAIAIGYNARVGCNNCAVIGGTGADSVRVGIGTTTPIAKLDIVGGDIAINNGEVLLRDGNDENHGLGWYGTGKPFGGIELDGPALYGYGGGALGFTNGTGPSGNQGVLFWKRNYRVGINVNDPSCALDVAKDQNGTEISPVRIRDLPTANAFQYDNVIVDNDGNLYRGVVGSRIAPEHYTNVLIKEQKELVKAKGLAIDELKIENETQNEIIQELKEKATTQQTQLAAQNQQLTTQQTQINELKSLVEQLLTQNAETPKGTSYVLPLEQKALLAQNQPNPFRENTLVDYFVPADVKNAHIQVTNSTGEVIGQVQIIELGQGQVTIQSKNYAAGTYFYSLVLDGQVTETKRMVLAR